MSGATLDNVEPEAVTRGWPCRANPKWWFQASDILDNELLRAANADALPRTVKPRRLQPRLDRSRRGKLKARMDRCSQKSQRETNRESWRPRYVPGPSPPEDQARSRRPCSCAGPRRRVCADVATPHLVHEGLETYRHGVVCLLRPPRGTEHSDRTVPLRRQAAAPANGRSARLREPTRPGPAHLAGQKN